MIVALFVIAHRGTAGHLLRHCKRHGAHTVFYRGCRDGKLKVAKRLAHIPAGAFGQVAHRIRRHGHRLALLPGQALHSAAQTGGNVVRRQGFELKHRTAGKQSVINVKVRVFGG